MLVSVFSLDRELNKLRLSPKNNSVKALVLLDPIHAYTTYVGDRSFNFLNLHHTFKHKVDWNFKDNGKLWTYNLNYFDFLGQPSLTKEVGLSLMLEFGDQYNVLKDALEPYPSSLRILNWIKFIVVHEVKNETIDGVVYSDWTRLQRKLEYHLMGNHLLENSFALLFGAFYFNDFNVYLKSAKILRSQLEEQILSDGGHFELSPMYHQLMLHRVLDCINLLDHNKFLKSDLLLKQLKEGGEKMLAWLHCMTFSNGEIPLLNDSAREIAPSTAVLTEYAEALRMLPKQLNLDDSGYRKYKGGNYELIIDIGNIGPDYIPGHAHSDSLGFVLDHQQKPLIVDTGISTYEKNKVRASERATSAHNTVAVKGREQSEVWGGFRVAKRAKTTLIEDNINTAIASHDGYKNIGIIHKRAFYTKENAVVIEDELNKVSIAKAFIHFYPGVTLRLKMTELSGDFGKINFEEADSISLEEYPYALGYNKTTEAFVVVIAFKKKLKTTITLR